jgi:hypothetical protein
MAGTMRKLLVVLTLAGLAAPVPAHAGRLGDLVGAPVRSLFRKLAAAKRDRVFHAEGQAYKATFIQNNVRTDAIVRVSRGGAGKAGKPDILGLAVKTEGINGDQDYLLVTSKSDTGIKARLASFEPSFGGKTFSSLTSFKLGGVKGAITTELPEGFATPLDLGASAAPQGTQRFDLSLQKGGLFTARRSVLLGSVVVDFDKPLSADASKLLHFTPWHDGDGIKPAGLINWLRKPAYLGSQEGRSQ